MKKQKRSGVSHRFSSYILVGISAFLVEYISFFVLISLASQLLVAQSVSFLLGLTVSFYGNRNHTFSSDDNYALTGRSQLRRYVLLALCNLLLTNVLIYLLVHTAAIDPVIAKVVVMGSVVAWNYLIFSKVIFKTK